MYKPRLLTCKICGELITDKELYGKRKFHNECVISEYIDACNEGTRWSDLRRMRFRNHGFTKADVEAFKAKFKTEE